MRTLNRLGLALGLLAASAAAFIRVAASGL